MNFVPHDLLIKTTSPSPLFFSDSPLSLLPSSSSPNLIPITMEFQDPSSSPPLKLLNTNHARQTTTAATKQPKPNSIANSTTIPNNPNKHPPNFTTSSISTQQPQPLPSSSSLLIPVAPLPFNHPQSPAIAIPWVSQPQRQLNSNLATLFTTSLHLSTQTTNNNQPLATPPLQPTSRCPYLHPLSIAHRVLLSLSPVSFLSLLFSLASPSITLIAAFFITPSHHHFPSLARTQSINIATQNHRFPHQRSHLYPNFFPLVYPLFPLPLNHHNSINLAPNLEPSSITFATSLTPNNLLSPLVNLSSTAAIVLCPFPCLVNPSCPYWSCQPPPPVSLLSQLNQAQIVELL